MRIEFGRDEMWWREMRKLSGKRYLDQRDFYEGNKSRDVCLGGEISVGGD